MTMPLQVAAVPPPRHGRSLRHAAACHWHARCVDAPLGQISRQDAPQGNRRQGALLDVARERPPCPSPANLCLREVRRGKLAARWHSGAWCVSRPPKEGRLVLGRQEEDVRPQDQAAADSPVPCLCHHRPLKPREDIAGALVGPVRRQASGRDHRRGRGKPGPRPARYSDSAALPLLAVQPRGAGRAEVAPPKAER